MATVFIAAALLFTVSCVSGGTITYDYHEKASVTFVNVGQGDCAVISLPDGKTMVIDCGEKSEKNLEQIKDCLDLIGCDKIDYLILSHTDGDHTGNAADLIYDYGVGTAYIPSVNNLSDFIYFSAAVTALKERADNIKISCIGEEVIENDYFFCFLYPDEELYVDLNALDADSDTYNAASSILYLDCLGVRMIFTGDAPKSAEEQVVLSADAGLYGLYGGLQYSVNLNSIDFLKVSHHGGKEEISETFYERLLPQNAVISCGVANSYNHPSQYMLTALVKINPDINILRTDYSGNISAKILDKNNYVVVTDAN